MYQGSCLCGEVAFTVSGEISAIIHCHCSLCRKASGTAFATNGFVHKQDFELTKGSHLLQFYERKPGMQRHFCSVCATPIFSSNVNDALRIRLRIGAVDSDIQERPISHNFVPSKANGEDLDADLPRYEQHEPNR